MAMVSPLAGAAQPLPLTAAPYGSAVAPSAMGQPGVLPLQQRSEGGASVVAAASVPAQLVPAAGLSQPGLAVVHGAEQPPVVSAHCWAASQKAKVNLGLSWTYLWNLVTL